MTEAAAIVAVELLILCAIAIQTHEHEVAVKNYIINFIIIA